MADWQKIIDKDVAEWNNKHPGVIYTGEIHRPKWLRPKK